MNNTKIEWCDATFNPVSGCKRDCDYCYAKRIARRFAARDILSDYLPESFCRDTITLKGGECEEKKLHILEEPETYTDKSGEERISPFPFGFDPTFHKYRLGDSQKAKKPKNVFVGSDADLFGEWVPDEWIAEVFKACEAAPWHRYLFLTKNPKRYIEWMNFYYEEWNKFEKVFTPDANKPYFGTSITNKWDLLKISDLPFSSNKFLSIEPLLSELPNDFFEYYIKTKTINWVIIGAESGNNKNKVIPKLEWIKEIKEACEKANIPVFMKNSLAGIWQGELIQQFPWEVK